MGALRRQPRQMQPDKMEWIQRGGLHLTDIPEMITPALYETVSPE